MKVFLFAASLRKGSYNKKLVRIAADLLSEHVFCEVEVCEFNEFPMPMFNADIAEEFGIPDSIAKLGNKIQEADAVIISTPEYNGSIPGTLKNAIDWLSMLDPNPLAKKYVCLIGASDERLGGVRGNIHCRVPFHILGAYMYPNYFDVALSDTAFDEKGQLKDPKQVEKLNDILGDFLRFASRKESPFDVLDDFIGNRDFTRSNNANH
ncbi:NADPH-dependent FMN reductase [Bdellovibrio reynosensis]|uniref:NAD(P)H-dependent oxidoreductase n=1 Tax=Bdellovibrio reynosensis TaxID=2835041 RepID=A0ABY4CBN4_9BACT|nr:NAD(P)H-dependent oxidoreductase [Bdellovibrio reynosensis]UOF02194.1 NAD(P)H-dependent oxidoreductase [Bdellovibrio reynosensis]